MWIWCFFMFLPTFFYFLLAHYVLAIHDNIYTIIYLYALCGWSLICRGKYVILSKLICNTFIPSLIYNNLEVISLNNQGSFLFPYGLNVSFLWLISSNKEWYVIIIGKKEVLPFNFIENSVSSDNNIKMTKHVLKEY